MSDTPAAQFAENGRPCLCTYWSGGSSSYLSTCPCGLSGFCARCGAVFSWWDQRHNSRHPTQCDGSEGG